MNKLAYLNGVKEKKKPSFNIGGSGLESEA